MEQTASKCSELKPYLVRVWSKETRRLMAEHEVEGLSPDHALQKAQADFRKREFNPDDYGWSVRLDLEH